MCDEVKHYKGLLDQLNKELASDSVEGMAAGLRKIGVDPSKQTMKDGKLTMKAMIRSQEGGLNTALKLAEAGCNAEKKFRKSQTCGL